MPLRAVAGIHEDNARVVRYDAFRHNPYRGGVGGKSPQFRSSRLCVRRQYRQPFFHAIPMEGGSVGDIVIGNGLRLFQAFSIGQRQRPEGFVGARAEEKRGNRHQDGCLARRCRGR